MRKWISTVVLLGVMVAGAIMLNPHPEGARELAGMWVITGTATVGSVAVALWVWADL